MAMRSVDGIPSSEPHYETRMAMLNPHGQNVSEISRLPEPRIVYMALEGGWPMHCAHRGEMCAKIPTYPIVGIPPHRKRAYDVPTEY